MLSKEEHIRRIQAITGNRADAEHIYLGGSQPNPLLDDLVFINAEDAPVSPRTPLPPVSWRGVEES